jgi:hypothetical protein
MVQLASATYQSPPRTKSKVAIGDYALIGARILDRFLELGWLKCVSGSRALQLTSSGREGLSEIFQIEINNEGVPTGRLCDPRRLTA